MRNDQELDNMSIEEKKKRTSPVEMKKRGIVVAEFDKRLLCRNEYPHNDRPDGQYVLWARRPGDTKAAYNYSFHEAIKYIDNNLGEDYRIIRHAVTEKSCPFREHYHVYRIL